MHPEILQVVHRLIKQLFEKANSSLALGLAVAGIWSLLVGLLAAGLYYYFVGSKAIPGISADPSSWAQFGDYFGGVAGTIFSFFAFIGLLATLGFQAYQSQIDEVQRLLASLSSKIDALLEKTVVVSSASVGYKPHVSMPLQTLLKGSGHSAITSPFVDDFLREVARRQSVSAARDAKYELSELNVEFDQLAWCLQEFRNLGGSKIVMTFYIRRYSTPVCYLYYLGHVSDRSTLIFDPTNYKLSIAPAE